MLHILCMQKHREGSGLIISVLCRIGRGRPACPLEDYCHGYVRIGPVSSTCGELAQRLLMFGKPLSEGAMQVDVAVDMAMHHAAHPGQGWATAPSISTSTLA